MAYQIKWRNGTAAQWTSTNPILALGELGVENDTGKKKFGDGVSTWTSLSYAGPAGPAQTLILQSYGDGSDGNVTITTNNLTSGPLVSGALTRDAYFNNLTLSGSGSINCAGYKIFVANTLDLSAAGANAIQANGSSGTNASGASAGSAGAAQVAGSMGVGGVGGNGGAGNATTGSAGGAGTAVTGGGGPSGATGVGGSGNGNAGGIAGAASAVTIKFIRRWATNFLSGITLLSGGAGGRGGPGGGGDGTNSGGGGGGGGSGGGVVALYAKNIIRGTSTSTGVISAMGGIGGNGANGVAGIAGGGSGGAGGGGGWVYIVYQTLAGSTAHGAISVSGGNGGSGGNGVGGNGITTGTGGTGAAGGTGGRIYLLQSTTDSSVPINDVNLTVATSPAIFSVGGAGALGTITMQDL